MSVPDSPINTYFPARFLMRSILESERKSEREIDGYIPGIPKNGVRRTSRSYEPVYPERTEASVCIVSFPSQELYAVPCVFTEKICRSHEGPIFTIPQGISLYTERGFHSHVSYFSSISFLQIPFSPVLAITILLYFFIVSANLSSSGSLFWNTISIPIPFTQTLSSFSIRSI